MIAAASRIRTHRIMGRVNRSQVMLFSTNQKADDLVLTEVEEGKKVAKMVLNRPPVNSLSLEMCQSISKSIKAIESQHPKVQSLVLASSNPAILSAGIDLTELYNPDPHRLPHFWNAVQQLFIDLYGSRLAVICAIEGHAPALGCMLAMASDYRVMAQSAPPPSPSGTIGLNETKFGIAAPPWLGQLMIRTVGFRTAERALALGTLFSPEEAEGVGLVDRIVPKERVIGDSQGVAERWAAIPPRARVASKILARGEYIQDIIRKKDRDTEDFVTFITDDSVQEGLGRYLDSLKNKS